MKLNMVFITEYVNVLSSVFYDIHQVSCAILEFYFLKKEKEINKFY